MLQTKQLVKTQHNFFIVVLASSHSLYIAKPQDSKANLFVFLFCSPFVFCCCVVFSHSLYIRNRVGSKLKSDISRIFFAKKTLYYICENFENKLYLGADYRYNFTPTTWGGTLRVHCNKKRHIISGIFYKINFTFADWVDII